MKKKILNVIPGCVSGTKHSDMKVGGRGGDELMFQLVKALAPGLNGDTLLLKLQINNHVYFESQILHQ